MSEVQINFAAFLIHTILSYYYSVQFHAVFPSLLAFKPQMDSSRDTK